MIIRRGMSGEPVRKIQERLRQLSLYNGLIDSSFGGGTEAGIKKFQLNQQLSPTGLADRETWGRLFIGEELPISEFAAAPVADKCLALSGSFETGTQPPECYCGITGDFDGQGVSYGVLQWNVGQESLQPLLAEMIDQHGDVCSDIFHEHLPTLRSLGTASKEDQLAFARSIQNRLQVQEPWCGMLRALGRTAEFQAIQSRHAAAVMNNALKLCEAYQLATQRGAALMFDILVQNGSISPIVKSQILADYLQIPTGSPEDVEVARMRIIANRRAAASRPEFADDVRTRKLVIANGTGSVHGIFYDLADRFCITLEPFSAARRATTSGG